MAKSTPKRGKKTGIEPLRKVLAAHGQEHLLAFWDDLDLRQQDQLREQLSQVDWDLIAELIPTHVLTEPTAKLPESIEPPPIGPHEASDEATRKRYKKARATGEKLLRAGKVAAFVVAGGQGTRLGYDGPKGCLGVSPVMRKSLFSLFAEQLLATGRKYGKAVPWYIMTSPANDKATREYFKANGYFDLDKDDVMFFAQGTMPAIGLDGKLLLAEKDSLALSPNGHGGSLTALSASGALADMADRGVEVISYFQVDNPLVHCVDPLFVGLHQDAKAEMSAKALPKRDPLEKLGNFCIVDGKTTVIEYSDMPEDLARATRPDGKLKFSAGSIAIHLFSRTFVERLTQGGRCSLPFHRAIKKVPHIDGYGKHIAPDQPNAVKLEMFVFDALPLAKKSVILETARVEEFSPVKNATGPDSLNTCLHDQVRRFAAWLEAAGVEVPRDADNEVACAIEISPLFALDGADLAGKDVAEQPLEPGKPVYLGENPLRRDKRPVEEAVE